MLDKDWEQFRMSCFKWIGFDESDSLTHMEVFHFMPVA